MNKFTTSDNEIDLNYIINFLFSNKIFISKVAIISGIVFLSLSFTQNKLYKSNISFFKVKESNSISALSVDSILGGDSSINERLELDIKDMISSNEIARIIVNKKWNSIDSKNLISYWEFGKVSFLGKVLSLIPQNEEKENFKEIEMEEATIEELLDRMQITEDLKTGLITVYISTENRYLSVEILNYVKEFVLDFSSSNISALSAKEIEYLTTRIDKVQIEIDNIHSKIVTFLENNKTYKQSPTLTVTYQEILQEKTFINSVMITLLQQIEVAKLNQIKISPVIETLDSPKISAKKSSPRRSYWTFFGLLFGSTISILYLFIKKSK